MTTNLETKITLHCEAREGQREIDDWCARAIADMFHDGSGLTYGFASTGAIEDETELWRALFPDYESLPANEQLWAGMLGTYLIRAGKRGPVDGWSDISY